MSIPKKRNQDAPNYRSHFERDVGEFLGERATHEPERIYFTQPSKQRFYLPDFKTEGGVFIECKGRWVASDRQKHVWLKEQHPDKRIVLLFQDARIKLSKRSKTTYGEWATKNGLEWYSWKDGIPEDIIIKNDDRNSSGNKGRRSRLKGKLVPGASKVSS